MAKINNYPLIEEIHCTLSAIDIFKTFSHRKHSFFLDSGMDPYKLGRYSFIGSDPFLVLKSRGNDINITQDSQTKNLTEDPFTVLDNLLKTYQLDYHSSLMPFIGGAVGYLSYDLCHFIENLPSVAVDDLKLPECYFCFYDVVLAFDNLEEKAYIISTGFPESTEKERKNRAIQRLNKMRKRIACDAVSSSEIVTAPISLPEKEVTIKGDFGQQEYVKVIDKARQYIIDGDIFEVNISQRFESQLNIKPYKLYRKLRSINPAPFACYLGFDDVTVVSASPERFLRLQGDFVETRPIKGTRPRGNNPQQDEKLADELLNSVKDRAENMMIVDLERNDLGRVCRYGSVKVTEMAILEVFPTVFHLTSTVVGRLEEGKKGIDLLRATFPGGSITGAPKVRAMEIIDELEPTRRSIYTGNIGYLSFNGNLDLNIAIRTFIIKGKRVYFQVGGAVVYDSDPEAEYKETLHKAKALIDSLNAASTDAG